MFKRLLFFIIVLLIAFPTIVGAHTHLETSDPEENSVLNEDTGTITLIFESTVQELNEITLTHENGEELQLEEVTHEPADTFVVTLPEDLMEDGNHTLFYSIVGEDGHVMEQELAYQFESVEEEETVEETEEAADDQEASEKATEEELPETDQVEENDTNDASDEANGNTTLIAVIAIVLVIVAILAILMVRKKKK
ncbi:copper resistance CopC family protein [Gracilibacillus suaedae]|uniref:copper resistance CopC family protein n=1 Tax=Gracilibacillus suaedae TaxID=2820273 RepID=UPI001ABDC769|nr:copper resistance CopC family protein [Gracilibacillus suaedae]